MLTAFYDFDVLCAWGILCGCLHNNPMYVLSPCKGVRLALIRLYESITVLLTELSSYIHTIGQSAVWWTPILHLESRCD